MLATECLSEVIFQPSQGKDYLNSKPRLMIVGESHYDGVVGLMLSQQACILFINGNGEFTRSFVASGASAIAMTSADLNKDGKPDLIIGNFVLSLSQPT